MTVINKSVFCRNLNGARLLGHPVYSDHVYFCYSLSKRERGETSIEFSFRSDYASNFCLGLSVGPPA